MENYDRALLILGTKTDPHVSLVKDEIEKYSDIKVVVFDYHDDTRFTIRVTEHGAVKIQVNGENVPHNCLVWDRNKILPGTELYIQGDDETATGYVAQEWRALYTLIGGFNEKRVVNSLESRKCMIKPYQQVIAASVGMAVPETMITNDKANVLEFYGGARNGLIMKSVSAGKVKPASEGGEYIPYNVMTMRVNKEDLDHATEAEIGYCPHFFQEEIKKDYELRIVVVGDRVIPFRIGSQERRTTEVDWRKGMLLIEFTRCEIDSCLSTKIRQFMTKIGFFTGSIDIMVDQAGKHWFLECNQDGAWGWLDDLVKGEISRAFAEELTKKLDTLLDEPFYK
ncbi:hypothetical protein [Xanthomonas albilineans]|uniref:hypothetical protein n=1 Tax=Xanthomonas albilineans TaxID=29447 RepID=UPI000A49C79E|nr:hypothetical protein [Xanthomonas albilineans]